MKKPFPNRFTPLCLGAWSARNRIVVPAMASQTADHNGFATAETQAHYSRLAESGAGIVMVEYTYVAANGKSEERQLAVDCDDKIIGLRLIADRIKSQGALAILQLTHSLAKSTSQLTGGLLWGASAVAVPVKDRDMETPKELTVSGIHEIESAFIGAATRAREAGFHGIELHSAHGYGLNQMLSLLTNHRHDEFGSSLKNRARLLLAIVSEIKRREPQLLISVRVPGQDNLPGGLQLDDMQWVVRQLESLGVDIINVSSGLGGWRRPGNRSGEGYLVEDAAILQRSVGVPVIGVGGIESADFIDRALREKKFALAAVGRAILKDPAEFAAVVLQKKGASKNEHNRISYK